MDEGRPIRVDFPANMMMIGFVCMQVECEVIKKVDRRGLREWDIAKDE